jgi:hypothetical protein
MIGAWNSSSSIALWVITSLVTTVFVVQQHFALPTTLENRIFPVHFLRSRTLVPLFVATAAVSSSVFFLIYYVPLFFRYTRSDTAILAAVRLLPNVWVFVTCILLSGDLLPKVSWYSGWFPLSGILCLVGSVLMFLSTSTTSVGRSTGSKLCLPRVPDSPCRWAMLLPPLRWRLKYGCDDWLCERGPARFIGDDIGYLWRHLPELLCTEPTSTRTSSAPRSRVVSLRYFHRAVLRCRNRRLSPSL